MFEHLEEYGNEDGSQERHHERIQKYRKAKRSVLVYAFWWVFHNCVAHPLIGLFPFTPCFNLHDWSSHKINLKD